MSRVGKFITHDSSKLDASKLGKILKKSSDGIESSSISIINAIIEVNFIF